MSGLTAIVLLTLLALASRLQPDPSGHGTHRQLGLPPCTFTLLFDRPCPSCGMTTSWAHVMRGRLDRAVAANFSGALLALGAMAAAPWLLGAAVAGRWLGVVPRERWVAAAGLTAMGVTLADWLRRLMLNELY